MTESMSVLPVWADRQVVILQRMSVLLVWNQTADLQMDLFTECHSSRFGDRL